MTFHSLYRLEQRGLLSCPIVGVAVDDWSVEDLREHARKCIQDCGETIDDAVFYRFAARLSYLSGDFADDGTYGAWPTRVSGARTPSSTSRSPRPCSATVVTRAGRRRADRRGAGGGREALRPRPRLCRALTADAPPHRRVPALPDRPLPREDGAGEILFLRLANTMLEPIWNRNYVECVQITMAESLGSRTAATSTTRSGPSATWSSTT